MESKNNTRQGLAYSMLRWGVAALPRSLKDAVLTRIIHAQPETIKQAIHNLQEEVRLDQIVADSIEQFRLLSGRKNLKIHLGCGSELKKGWVNLDTNLNQNVPTVDGSDPETIFINYDLRRGLPLDEGSCDVIYSSHFFEHLEYQAGIKLMRECYRVLRPGGRLRISLPNFKRMFDAYLRGDAKYFDLVDLLQARPDVEPSTKTLIDVVNYGVYQYGEHKCIYDEEKLILLLQDIGYGSAVNSSFDPDIDPVDPSRQRYSFYTEAIK